VGDDNGDMHVARRWRLRKTPQDVVGGEHAVLGADTSDHLRRPFGGERRHDREADDPRADAQHRVRVARLPRSGSARRHVRLDRSVWTVPGLARRSGARLCGPVSRCRGHSADRVGRLAGEERDGQIVVQQAVEPAHRAHDEPLLRPSITELVEEAGHHPV
jgi:hypothetical protein